MVKVERWLPPHWVDYFTIENKSNFPVITKREVFDKDLSKGEAHYESLREKFFNNPKAESIQLKIPSNCAPRYDLDSPEKQKMLTLILQTTHDELMSFNKLYDFKRYPVKTQIVVSNFNIDYPEAFVFVPHTNEVFSLRLHYEKESFEEEIQAGSYSFGQIYDKHSLSGLKKKILDNGIPSELDLSRPFTP
jgi:hypothetical protein